MAAKLLQAPSEAQLQAIQERNTQHLHRQSLMRLDSMVQAELEKKRMDLLYAQVRFIISSRHCKTSRIYWRNVLQAFLIPWMPPNLTLTPVGKGPYLTREASEQSEIFGFAPYMSSVLRVCPFSEASALLLKEV